MNLREPSVVLAQGHVRPAHCQQSMVGEVKTELLSSGHFAPSHKGDTYAKGRALPHLTFHAWRLNLFMSFALI